MGSDPENAVNAVSNDPKTVFINNLEFDTGAAGCNPGDFAAFEMVLHGGGKSDFHRDFLPSKEALVGFNKRIAGTDGINRCSEYAHPGFAMCSRRIWVNFFLP